MNIKACKTDFFHYNANNFLKLWKPIPLNISPFHNLWKFIQHIYLRAKCQTIKNLCQVFIVVVHYLFWPFEPTDILTVTMVSKLTSVVQSVFVSILSTFKWGIRWRWTSLNNCHDTGLFFLYPRTLHLHVLNKAKIIQN